MANIVFKIDMNQQNRGFLQYLQRGYKFNMVLIRYSLPLLPLQSPSLIGNCLVPGHFSV